MRRPAAASRREPTIALINVVFLMLVFFMVSGTLAPPLDPGLTLTQTRDLDQTAPPDALILHPDGRLAFRGDDLDPKTAMSRVEERELIRIVPDRDASARSLAQLAHDLRAEGATRIVIVTEEALQ